jgi:hypothetical protein
VVESRRAGGGLERLEKGLKGLKGIEEQEKQEESRMSSFARQCSGLGKRCSAEIFS